MAEKVNISDKIAQQIQEIAEVSLELDLKILEYIKEDYEEIKALAKEQGLSQTQLIVEVLKGIEKGLIASGKLTLSAIKRILASAKKYLEELAAASSGW